VFYVRPELIENLPPIFGPNSRGIEKYESFGAHPDTHYLALGRSLEFLSTIGVEQIQARLFYLTRRWMNRASQLARFRAAVKPDPAQCAGLVAWEFEGAERAVVRAELFDRRKILTGGTEAYHGVFGIPEDQPRSLHIANTAIFTTPEDVDRFADALEAISRQL
jgi:selenocysteine lyase/cysteine desulfurase